MLIMMPEIRAAFRSIVSRDLARRRRDEFVAMAERHDAYGRQALRIQELASRLNETLATLDALSGDEASTDRQADHRAARWERAVEYHAAMKRKYERAARHPWLPVPPDPPLPE